MFYTSRCSRVFFSLFTFTKRSHKTISRTFLSWMTQRERERLRVLTQKKREISIQKSFLHFVQIWSRAYRSVCVLYFRLFRFFICCVVSLYFFRGNSVHFFLYIATLLVWRCGYMCTVSGIMYISRRRLGMEWKRFISASIEREQYYIRSSIPFNMLRHGCICYRLYRMRWGITWKYGSIISGKLFKTCIFRWTMPNILNDCCVYSFLRSIRCFWYFCYCSNVDLVCYCWLFEIKDG